MGLLDLLKKKRPTPQMGAINAKDTETKAPYNRRIKVAGVTFKNEDGSDRQKILRDILNKKPPFNKRLDLEIKEFSFDGEPAYYVIVNGKTVGTVESSMSAFITANQTRIVGISDFRVNEFQDENTGKVIYYAKLKIAVMPK